MGEEGEAPTHLGLTRSFVKSLGGAPGPQNCLLPWARRSGAGSHRQELLPDMGHPLLLPLLGLLLQTCVPGRAWVPKRLRWELGRSRGGTSGSGVPRV